MKKYCYNFDSECDKLYFLLCCNFCPLKNGCEWHVPCREGDYWITCKSRVTYEELIVERL